MFSNITLLSAPEAAEPCVFPFVLDGTTYNGCIHNQASDFKMVGSHTPDVFGWCPTEVDELGFPVSSRPCIYGEPKGQSTCFVRLPRGSPYSLRERPNCIFPFKYLGKTYSECTFDDDTEAWCAASLDLFGNMVGEKMRCGKNCPFQQPASVRLYICILVKH